MSDTRDALMVARNSEGKLVQRPLSPHIQVYQPQITSMVSITHRATGVALSAGTLLLVWWLVASAGGPHGYATMQGFVGSWLGLLVLCGWTASLFFHFLAGIRHLVWDSGYGYDLKATHASGWAVVGGTVVLTVLFWIIGLAAWHHGVR